MKSQSNQHFRSGVTILKEKLCKNKMNEFCDVIVQRLYAGKRTIN